MKIQRALEIVTAAEIQKWLAAPPPYRVLWSLGFEVRPPHFSNFVVNAITSGISFGLILGAIRLVHFTLTGAPSAVPAAISFFIPTLISSLLIATGVDAQKRRAGLPKWEEIDLPGRFD